MTTNPLAKVTPWPWTVSKGKAEYESCFFIKGCNQKGKGPAPLVAKSYPRGYASGSPGKPNQQNVDLISIAPDHTLLLAAIYAGKVEIWTRPAPAGPAIAVLESCPPTDVKLDSFGCPILTPELRAALRKAIGLDVQA